MKIALKIIKADFYSNFRRTADASNLPDMSGKLAQQYYNLLLPHISYFFYIQTNILVAKVTGTG